jgi:hypothetical protein
VCCGVRELDGNGLVVTLAVALREEEGLGLSRSESLGFSDSLLPPTGVFVRRGVGFSGKSGTAHPSKSLRLTKLLEQVVWQPNVPAGGVNVGCQAVACKHTAVNSAVIELLE